MHAAAEKIAKAFPLWLWKRSSREELKPRLFQNREEHTEKGLEA